MEQIKSGFSPVFRTGKAAMSQAAKTFLFAAYILMPKSGAGSCLYREGVVKFLCNIWFWSFDLHNFLTECGFCLEAVVKLANLFI